MYQSPSHHFSTYIYFTKYCKENPWTINVHNPSTKSNPFAGCGWHSIYWSAVVYSTSYCWDKATIMLLYKHNQSRDGRKKKRKYFCFNQNFLKKSFNSCGLFPRSVVWNDGTINARSGRVAFHTRCLRGDSSNEWSRFPRQLVFLTSITLK